MIASVEFRTQIAGQGGAGTSAGSGLTAQQQAARKVTKMCITIAATFTVAWLPYQLNLVVLSFGNSRDALTILVGLLTLAYVNSCVNPVIYALMWRPFRLSLIQVRQNFSTLLSVYTGYKVIIQICY